MLLMFIMGSILLYSTEIIGNTPKYSNEFLSVGVGARGIGMSNAFTSVSNDASSSFWNPAGLTAIEDNLQVMLMHTQHFGGIARHDFGALSFNLDQNSALAFSFVRMGVEDIPDTSELIDTDGNINYDRIRSFNAADNAFFVSYARKLKPDWSVGASTKIIRRTAGSFAGAWGFGLDLGTQYFYNNFTFALMARDVTSTFNAWSYTFDERMIEAFTLSNNEIPENSIELTLPSITLGVSAKFRLADNFGLIASSDMKVTTDGRRNVLMPGDPFSIDPSLGLEINYKEVVFLRAGINDYQKYTKLDESFGSSLRFNMGLGVSIRKVLSIEYALTNVGDNSIALYSNVFSVKFNINRKD